MFSAGDQNCWLNQHMRRQIQVAVVNITSNEGSNPNVTKPKAAVDFALIVLGLCLSWN